VSAVPVDLGAPAARPPLWLPAAEAKFADAPAADVLAWAVDTFGSELTVACSMQDGVLVDLAVTADPGVEVVFLDTGFHFGETLTTAQRMKARYDLNLVTLRPRVGADSYDVDGTDACCAARKVAPLERHLERRAAWVTGLRRAESPTRSAAGSVEWDSARQMVKINPIAAWTDDDVARYIADHDIIVNPLRDKGYASIGCAPCTVPGSGRDGRWADSGRLECGLHLVSRGG
jgi:phosphoadenosine phosphosulfate reductase